MAAPASGGAWADVRAGSQTPGPDQLADPLVEGDLTADELRSLSSVLAEPAEPLSAERRAEWLAELSGVSFVSDGSLPFRDNVDHGRRHGVDYIAEPGGSIRSDEVAETAARHGITIIRTGVRLFHH